MGDTWADDVLPAAVASGASIMVKLPYSIPSLEEQKVPDSPVDLKKRRGRPKGSKGKLNLKIQRIAQEETQND